MVDVEQRALRALEQEVAARWLMVCSIVADVGQRGFNCSATFIAWSKMGWNSSARGAEVAGQRQFGVVQRQQLAQLGGEALGCFRSCTRSARRATLSS